MSPAALLAVLLLAPAAFGCVEPWSRALLESSLLLLAAAAVRRSPWPPGAAWAPAAAAAGLAALGGLQALTPAPPTGPSSWLPSSWNAAASARGALLWAAYAALLACVPRACPDLRAVRRLAWGLFYGGAALAAGGLMQIGQGNASIYGLRDVPGTRSPYGPIYNSSHAASMLLISAGLGLGLGAGLVRRWTRTPDATERSNIGAALAGSAFGLALIIAALIKIDSRGASAAVALSCALFAALAALKAKPRRGAAALAAALCLLPAAAALAAAWRIAERGWDFSLSARADLLRIGLRLLRDFPWAGIGLDAFEPALPAYRPAGADWFTNHLHSDWLELPMQFGLPAAALALAALWSAAKTAARTWRDCKSLETSFLLSGAACAAAGFLAHGAVDFSFQTPAAAVWFLTLLALLGHPRAWSAPASATPKAGRSGGPAAAGLGLLAVAALAALLPGPSAQPRPEGPQAARTALWEDLTARGTPKPLPFPPDPDGAQARSWGRRGRTYLTLRNETASSCLAAPEEALSPRWRPVFEARRDPRELLRRAGEGWCLRPGQALILEKTPF